MVSTPVEQNLRFPCHPRKIWRPLAPFAQDYRVSIGRIDQGSHGAGGWDIVKTHEKWWIFPSFFVCLPDGKMKWWIFYQRSWDIFWDRWDR